MIIAIYKDDGPTNGCGQDVILTAPREEAHTFPTYEDFRHADCVLLKSSERKEARYIKWYEVPDTIPRATVAAALRELRAKLDSMMFNERHKTPFDAIQKAQVELNATIAALGLEPDAFDALIASRPDALEKLADEALEEKR